MKKYILTLAICLLSLGAVEAQDVIAHRDGTVSVGKVTEINKDEIKYKKADNPDGPSYTLKVADLLSIRFENGTQEIFNQNATTNERKWEEDDDEDDENDEENIALLFRPELRLRLDAPCNEIVEGGGGVMAVAGVQINKVLSFGPGLGIMGHRYLHDDLSAFECPVFIQGRAKIPTKSISPYLIGQVGYTFGKIHDHADLLKGCSDRLGLFTSIGLGFSMKLKRGSLFMDLTWNAQQWRDCPLDNPTSFGISGGYFFERRR